MLFIIMVCLIVALADNLQSNLLRTLAIKILVSDPCPVRPGGWQSFSHPIRQEGGSETRGGPDYVDYKLTYHDSTYVLAFRAVWRGAQREEAAAPSLGPF
jgi:hypothetical protein